MTEDVTVQTEINLTAYAELLDVLRAARTVVGLSPTAPTFAAHLQILEAAVYVVNAREAGDSIPGRPPIYSKEATDDRAAAAGWGKYPDPVRAERESIRQYPGTYDTKPLNPSKVVSRVREGLLDGSGLMNPERLVTEASELDLPPGIWPDEVHAIRTDGSVDVYRFANPIGDRLGSPDGEIRAMRYVRADGTELHVLND